MNVCDIKMRYLVYDKRIEEEAEQKAHEYVLRRIEENNEPEYMSKEDKLRYGFIKENYKNSYLSGAIEVACDCYSDSLIQNRMADKGIDPAEFFAKKLDMAKEEFLYHLKRYRTCKEKSVQYDYGLTKSKYTYLVNECADNRNRNYYDSISYAKKALESLKAAHGDEAKAIDEQSFINGVMISYLTERLKDLFRDIDRIFTEFSEDSGPREGLMPSEYQKLSEEYYECEKSGKDWMFVPEELYEMETVKV